MSERKQVPVKKKWEKIKLPHTLVIIFAITLLAVLLTWIIPAGEYIREENAEGITVVDPDSFHYIDSKGVNPIQIPKYMVEGFKGAAALICFTLICGGAFDVIVASEAMQSLVGRIAKKLAHKEAIFIPMLTTMFALICTTQSIETFIGFAPVMVMIMMAFGFDSICAAAILIIGGGIGFSTGTLNPNTTAVAQRIAELPLYSGIGYRFVCMAVFLVFSNIYLIRYARRIRATPSLSPMYELDRQRPEVNVEIDSFGEMTLRKWLVVAALVVTLALIVYGSIKLGWSMDYISAAFIWMAVVAGFAAGFNPSKIASCMVNGAKRVVSIALIIGSARAISGILSAGAVLDTVVYGLSKVLMVLPNGLRGIAMYIANIIVNLFLTSGSGQAAVVMPIFIPMADMVGISRQTAILAFNFGDGFCNYILPYSTTTMGIIGNCGVPYEKWMKFTGKLFAIWVAVGSAMVLIAQLIGYGPM